MSFTLFHNPLCRDCCKRDSVSHAIHVTNLKEGQYEKYLNMTEYEASIIVEAWLKDFGPCRNCSSNNIFPTNIEIGDHKLYDFDKLVSITKNLGARGNLLILDLQNNYGEIDLKVAGKSNNDSDFLLECIVLFRKTLNEIDEFKFIPKRTDGNFQIVISGKHENSEYVLKVERIINYGFSYNIIMEKIMNYFMTIPL
jgi:hypothetical protein